jgi:hypothetical protein
MAGIHTIEGYTYYYKGTRIHCRDSSTSTTSTSTTCTYTYCRVFIISITTVSSAVSGVLHDTRMILYHIIHICICHQWHATHDLV